MAWVTTMALVNLGWIFFRAHSLPQARQMLRAIFSGASYGTHFLSTSLYVLVVSVAAGYGVALMVIGAVEGQATKTDSEVTGAGSGMVALMARWRWYWLPPLYGLVLVFLLIVTLTRGAGIGQFMYNKF
jgi:hypothetical protein